MAGAVSALFLLDIKGRVLVWRDYRGDVSAVQAERFFTKLIEKEVDPDSHDPVVYDNGVTYMFIQHNNVFLMTAARQNCNAASILLFLHRVIDVFKHYFEELEEESLRDNFVVVYELLDEMMDFGYPQYTEAKILSEFIKTDAYRMEVTQRPPMAVTNAVSWRSEGIKYKKNEVFLDVVESVNILVNSNGQIIRSDVVGALKMRTYLSGMPECKLGLNDRVLLEAQGRTTKGKAIDLDDIKFHQCVRLARFENDRTISFIPPDGSFDLMTYRLSTQVKPLIWVEAQVERHSRSRIEIMVKSRSQFKERSTATNVEIELPVPADATNPSIRTSMGSAAYAPENDALVWKIKSFPGGKEYMLRAEFSLPSITAEEAAPEKKAPIRVKFEIPYFTVSGIQVRYLKIIEKSGYQALPWVRYITMAGEYELRWRIEGVMCSGFKLLNSSAGVPPPALPSLLPPSLNPSAAVVDLLTSRLRLLSSPSSVPSLIPPHLLPFLGPSELSSILLRTQSTPIPALHLLSFLQSRHILTPSPHHLSLLAHSLTFSRLFSQSLCTISRLVLTHPAADPFAYLLCSASSGRCNWHPNVFSLLVRAYLGLGFLGRALDAFHRSVLTGFQPDVITSNFLLDSLAKFGSLERCWGVYSAMRNAGVVPNVYTFNILINALCRGEDAKRAKEFLEEIEMEGFDPDVVTYNTLINGYCRKGRVEEALRLFKVMFRRGVEPDLVSYKILMKGLCKEGGSGRRSSCLIKCVREVLQQMRRVMEFWFWVTAGWGR
ncbi:hypothetical protein HPP92_024515 [Vanilla planifolia]|uniref:MHD domain-containing protein n=1 Tax=Vanilla planifolia TaxID=51239 RepID=A0A835PPY4_VANPL|nr:hypothetical protein HPP92_024515 [Vanilla planifolia]